jgi:hypothetical protein
VNAYLVWSDEFGRWWADEGYTSRISEARRFDRGRAMGKFEVAVRLEDAEAIRVALDRQCPGIVGNW